MQSLPYIHGNFKKAMKGMGLGLRSLDKEYWLGAWGKPHKIPLDMGLDIFTNYVNVMSCTLHGFLLGLW